MNSARLRVVQPRGSQQPARRSTRTVYFTSSDPKVYIPFLAKSNFKGVTSTIVFEPNGELKNAATTLYTYKGGKKAPM